MLWLTPRVSIGEERSKMQDQLLVEQGRTFARAFRNAWYAEVG